MMTEKKELYTAKRDSGIDATAVVEAWSECRSKPSGSAYILVGFDDAVKDKLVVKYSGDDGGIKAIRGHLSTAESQNQVLFGAIPFQLSGNQSSGSSSSSSKYAFFTWVGPSVGGMKKGRVSLQKQGVYNIFEGVIADVGIRSSEEDMQDASLLDSLKKSTGKSELVLAV